jgi:peptidoglycan biosynthesis protein MviN/MurJ (putative lipid II flippase)
MTMGEKINFWGSLAALAGCLLFIAVYTVMPFVTRRQRWWSSRIGRLLITKAVALSGLMFIVVIYYVAEIDQEWIRAVRGIFAAVIGVMMLYQGWLVFRTMQSGGGDEG